MTLLKWLASSDARNKEKMEKTEVNRIKQNGPERVAASEVEAKKMKLALTLYDHASSPLLDMEIATLMGGMIAVTKIRAKMFMPIGYFETVKPLSGSVRYFHVATLNMPTDKLQTFLRDISKKVITWHHRAVSAFQYLHKNIYGRGDINNQYVNVANVLGISDVSTRLRINV